MLAIFTHLEGCHLEGQNLFFIIPVQNNGFKLQEDYSAILDKKNLNIRAVLTMETTIKIGSGIPFVRGVLLKARRPSICNVLTWIPAPVGGWT